MTSIGTISAKYKYKYKYCTLVWWGISRVGWGISRVKFQSGG